MSEKKSSKALAFIKKLETEISELIIRIDNLSENILSNEHLIEIRNLNDQLENLIAKDKNIKMLLLDMLKCDSELKLLTEFDKLKKSSDDESEDEEVKQITDNRINILKSRIIKSSSEINNIVSNYSKETEEPPRKKQKTDTGKKIKMKSKSRKKKSHKKKNAKKRSKSIL
jgi:hypothetical protein